MRKRPCVSLVAVAATVPLVVVRTVTVAPDTGTRVQGDTGFRTGQDERATTWPTSAPGDGAPAVEEPEVLEGLESG